METDKKPAVKPVASIKTAAVRSEAQIVIPEVVTKEEKTVKKTALKKGQSQILWDKGFLT